MTPSENSQLAALREDLLSEISSLRDEVRPAVAFYTTMSQVFLGIGRFARWGVGIGSGAATIIVAGRALGVL